ncbi:hypothetical protein GGI13_001015 [Coemansia sp. RSA 455]|nr:hypothetical protein GGI13_001015 [Coemansia sp. RSA 455]
MPTPSLIQLLPLHVVKLIVNHVVGSSRMKFDEVWTDSQEYKALLKPLLWVSHNLRAIALPLYCNYFKIHIPIFPQGANGVYDLLPRRPGDDRASYKYLGHTTHHLAKELKVELDERAIYSGRALEVLSCVPYDGCAFPLVRKFALTLVTEELDDVDKSADIDLPRAQANIKAFVERVDQLAPIVREVRVRLEDFYLTDSADRLVGYLASLLFQLADRVNYDYEVGSATPVWQHLDTICNLTHITYTSLSSDESFLQSVRRNASTLQALDIDSEDEYVDIGGLIRNTDGSYVTYPCLLKLFLCWREDYDDDDRVVSSDVVPFPILQRLMILTEYPFGDDVVFRGNASTLECLNLKLTNSVVSMLRGFNVFTPLSHPKLQYVNIEDYEGDIPDLFATPIDYTQFVLGIGTRAHMRRIDIASIGRSIIPALSLPGAHTCIEVLKLSSLKFNLWDVFTLVKSLPLLADLHTRAPAIDNFPNAISKDELLAHVISNYAPMGERLRFWYVMCPDSYEAYTRAALCVLLLALKCPNFTHTATFRCQREPLMKAMEEIIASDAFQPYAPRLQRLLFKGWDAENFSFSTFLEECFNNVELLLQNSLRHNYATVSKLAMPCDPAISTMARELAENSAADLETCLSEAAYCQGRNNKSWGLSYAGSAQGEGRDINILDAWAIEMFDALLLLVAHHVKACIGGERAMGVLKPDNCRLILPIAQNDTDSDNTDIYPDGCSDCKAFAHIECGMFPLGSSVETQVASAHHNIVTGISVAAYSDGLERVVQLLTANTMALFYNQHNRRFAWGLTFFSRIIHAYVFGPDDIWASTEMDITSAEGHLAFIPLLVDWSLSSVDRLGFDPSIRYIVGDIGSGPYLEIDVHEMGKSTGQVDKHTYYSKRCVGAADHLFGCHSRYFVASTSPERLDAPEFLIKDLWTTSNSGSTNDTRENSVNTALQGVFNKSSKFGGSFLYSAGVGPVYISQGGTLVADSTDSAFKGLLDIGHIRQHKRTVFQWDETMISAAANPSQVIIAIADAMTALNAAYVKCRIIHGNLSDRAIQFEETADGINGVLGELDYSSYAGGSTVEAPEIMLFQPIHALDCRAIAARLNSDDRAYAETQSKSLDNWECMLYIICVLGTFGINQGERARYPKGESGYPRIKGWGSRNAVIAAVIKREDMDSARSFYTSVAKKINEGPLRQLAVDMHRILFPHPECPGTKVADGEDPLVLRDAYEDDIVAELLRVVEQHKKEALVTLRTTGSTTAERAEQSTDLLKKRKRKVVTTTSPMMTRSRASRSSSKF